MEFLALYTFSGGPISVCFDAPSVDAAAEIVARDRQEWCDAKEDALHLPEGTPDEAVDAALVADGWHTFQEIVRTGAHMDSGYDLFSRRTGAEAAR
jgi:hypothetical protein